MASPAARVIRKRIAADGSAYYQARITLRGKTIHLGSFSSEAEAVKIRRRAEEQVYLPIIWEWDRLHREKPDD